MGEHGGAGAAVAALLVAVAALGCDEDRYFPPNLTDIQACFDGEQDRRETDVDCGGPLCPGCPSGGRCVEDDDCRSGQCVGGACLDLCTDGVLNGNETETDCGGALCPGCALGAACRLDEDCESWSCREGVCVPCSTGDVRCVDNWVRRCGPDGTSYENVRRCDPRALLRCDEASRGCVEVDTGPVGGTTPTGEYYQYAHFGVVGSPFLGGCDVDSAGNTIFVNRDGSHLDVYTVELEDPGADPDQHPDNPDSRGPVAARALTLVDTYDLRIGGSCSNELYVDEASGDLGAPSIVFIGACPEQRSVCRFDIATGDVSRVAPAPTGSLGSTELLGFDSVESRWFTGGRDRVVSSFDPEAEDWNFEFSYPDLAGSHADGLEVVVDPRTSIPYVYVSDMTSDFIAQYRRSPDGSWVQENLFQYYQLEGDAVEGMGFGAFNHFWATSGTALYEIGGGDIEEYVLY